MDLRSVTDFRTCMNRLCANLRIVSAREGLTTIRIIRISFLESMKLHEVLIQDRHREGPKRVEVQSRVINYILRKT